MCEIGIVTLLFGGKDNDFQFSTILTNINNLFFFANYFVQNISHKFDIKNQMKKKRSIFKSEIRRQNLLFMTWSLVQNT
jgi:hypothetical protein